MSRSDAAREHGVPAYRLSLLHTRPTRPCRLIPQSLVHRVDIIIIGSGAVVAIGRIHNTGRRGRAKAKGVLTR